MLLLADREAQGVYNVSTSILTSIRELAEEIRVASAYQGKVEFDPSQPAGQMQRIFDTTKMDQLGWKPKVSFKDGIRKTVDWFRANRSSVRER